jgi:RHS repeat-associated protein
MAMPNRNVVGDYRYNYQGQELDPETGKVAFQLRLYDTRINRWLTTDPAKQYASPYMAMGNNWMNGTDPDGALFIIDDFLFGFIGGLFQNRDNFSDPSRSRFGNAISNGSRMANNSANIWASLGRTDPDKTLGGKILQVASKLTWELPQSLGGVLSGHLVGYANGIEEITNYHGATLIRTRSLEEFGDNTDNIYWGFTVGSVITTSYTKSESLRQHEYGHYLTSRFQGPLFIPANILSPVSAAFGYDFHTKMPWEKWADRRSHRFFNNRN